SMRQRYELVKNFSSEIFHATVIYAILNQFHNKISFFIVVRVASYVYIILSRLQQIAAAVKLKVYSFVNWSLPTPQIGHKKSSGKFSKEVPGAMSLAGSPACGSYTQPQTVHTYLSIVFSFV